MSARSLGEGRSLGYGASTSCPPLPPFPSPVLPFSRSHALTLFLTNRCHTHPVHPFCKCLLFVFAVPSNDGIVLPFGASYASGASWSPLFEILQSARQGRHPGGPEPYGPACPPHQRTWPRPMDFFCTSGAPARRCTSQTQSNHFAASCSKLQHGLRAALPHPSRPARRGESRREGRHPSFHDGGGRIPEDIDDSVGQSHPVKPLAASCSKLQPFGGLACDSTSAFGIQHLALVLRPIAPFGRRLA